LGGKNAFLEGKDFCSYRVSKKICLSTTKFGGEQKYLGVTASECPPYLRAWAELSPERLPLGEFMFVQGG